jgi:hypothetical protein
MGLVVVAVQRFKGELSMAKGSDITGTIVAGLFFLIALLMLPRIFSSIAASNAAIATQTQPGAATNAGLARLIGSGFNLGTSLVNDWGSSLLPQDQ